MRCAKRRHGIPRFDMLQSASYYFFYSKFTWMSKRAQHGKGKRWCISGTRLYHKPNAFCVCVFKGYPGLGGFKGESNKHHHYWYVLGHPPKDRPFCFVDHFMHARWLHSAISCSQVFLELLLTLITVCLCICLILYSRFAIESSSGNEDEEEHFVIGDQCIDSDCWRTCVQIQFIGGRDYCSSNLILLIMHWQSICMLAESSKHYVYIAKATSIYVDSRASSATLFH